MLAQVAKVKACFLHHTNENINRRNYIGAIGSDLHEPLKFCQLLQADCHPASVSRDFGPRTEAAPEPRCTIASVIDGLRSALPSRDIAASRTTLFQEHATHCKLNFVASTSSKLPKQHHLLISQAQNATAKTGLGCSGCWRWQRRL